MLESVLPYLEAVGGRWIAVVGGFLPMALDISERVLPTWKAGADRAGFTAPRRRVAEVIVLILAILWAGFGAWSEEHAKRSEAEDSLSKAQRDVADLRAKPAVAAFPPKPPSLARMPTRSRFTQPLKSFYSEGSRLRLEVQGGLGVEEGKARQARVDAWMVRTADWVCANMGAYAYAKFLEPRIPLTPTVAVEPSNRVSSAMIGGALTNLSEIIDHDTWDPEGRVVRPDGGCKTS